MTEYDYSPEAQEKYVQNLRRIANWVDDTGRHASEFRNPFVPSDSGGQRTPTPRGFQVIYAPQPRRPSSHPRQDAHSSNTSSDTRPHSYVPNYNQPRQIIIESPTKSKRSRSSSHSRSYSQSPTYTSPNTLHTSSSHHQSHHSHHSHSHHPHPQPQVQAYYIPPQSQSPRSYSSPHPHPHPQQPIYSTNSTRHRHTVPTPVIPLTSPAVIPIPGGSYVVVPSNGQRVQVVGPPGTLYQTSPVTYDSHAQLQSTKRPLLKRLFSSGGRQQRQRTRSY